MRVVASAALVAGVLATPGAVGTALAAGPGDAGRTGRIAHSGTGIGAGAAATATEIDGTAGAYVARGSASAVPAAVPVAEPSQAYLDAVAHASRTYAFAPGAPAHVPLRPRAPAGAIGGAPTPGGPSPDAAAVPSGLRAASTLFASGGSTLRRQVYGFLPYWELVDPDLHLDYASLSTIAYFSVAASATGSLVTSGSDGTATSGWAGWQSQAFTDIIDAAHANGVTVDLTLTLFAWTTSQAKAQTSVLSSATARAALVQNLVGAVTGRGADGINLDVEPLVAGQEQNLVTFVQQLRSALDAAGPGRRITVDTLGSPENYPLEDLVAPGAADAIFVMGYDYRGSGASSAGSIAPLTSSAYDITETVDRYLARVPADHLLLGVPYYGRAWSTVTDALRAKTQSGAKYGYSSTANYSLAAQLADENGRRWDPDEQGPWAAYQRDTCPPASTCSTSWRELYYDDAESLGLKYQLADSRNLAGVGMWALGYDGQRPELAALLRQMFGGGPVGDTTPPVASLAVLPASAPDEGVVVTWSGTDAVGVTAYDVQASTADGPWTDWLTGVVGTSDVWSGTNGRGYAFRVRAHDAAGNVSAWTTETASTAVTPLARGGFIRVAVSGVALRASPSTTAKRIATAKVGDVFLVTGGPKSVGGASWVQVSGPLVEWPIVAAVRTKAWIAVKQGKTLLAAPTRRPSSTVIAAGLGGYSFDGGRGVSLGPDAVARRSFSPNGDLSRDTLAIEWSDSGAMTGVTATILRPDGSVAGTVPIGALPKGWCDLAWDGRMDGAVVPDGTYIVEIAGRSAGVTYHAPSAHPVTQAQLDRFGVIVDTVAPVVASPAISATSLDPEGAGPASVTVTGSAPDATHWTLSVVPVTAAGPGALVSVIRGDGSSASATWDATSDAGGRLPGGTYRLALRMFDAAGNAGIATWDVTLVRAGPQLTATVTPASISPNGDGTNDATTIAWTADVAVSGAIRVLRGTSLVRTWTQAAATHGSVRWDGTDGKGKPLADGAYHVEVALADATGLPATADLPLIVDRTVGAFAVTPARFAPADGDTLAATTRVTYRLAGPATTRLVVLDPAGVEVRTAWDGRADGPGSFGWTWDGRADGAYVVDGTYTVVLRATTALGTTGVRRSVVVGAFEVRLSATTVAVGDRLVVTAVAAEPLKAVPVFTLTQAGLAPVKVTGTAAGTGRWIATFTIRPGGAGTAQVTVAGRDAAGGSEVSRATLEVR